MSTLQAKIKLNKLVQIKYYKIMKIQRSDLTALTFARNWSLLRRGLELQADICLLFTQTGSVGRAPAASRFL